MQKGVLQRELQFRSLCSVTETVDQWRSTK